MNDYIPEVIRVIPTNNYKVYVYFDDGSIKLFDASELITKGIFTALQDIDVFKNTCTILNGTLAWDLEGNRDRSKSLDLDPLVLYETCPDVIKKPSDE